MKTIGILAEQTLFINLFNPYGTDFIEETSKFYHRFSQLWWHQAVAILPEEAKNLFILHIHFMAAGFWGPFTNMV